jgi:hypothetical protein
VTLCYLTTMKTARLNTRKLFNIRHTNKLKNNG